MNGADPSRNALDPRSEAGETLADLGEWELIRRLGAFAPPGQFSDDAALLEDPEARPAPAGDGMSGQLPDCAAAGRTLVINTDLLVEGIHFSDATTSPADVGWRAAAANLSDLAAMGAGHVVGLTVGLVAPAGTPWAWVEEVYRGIDACLQAHGGVLLGGDCSGGAQRLLAITALGRLTRDGGPIRRGDGRPGDRLVSTGPHGLSRLGLALLQGELPREGATGRPPSTAPVASLPEALIRQAIRAHQRPVPRFDAVASLIASQPAGQSWRVGGCDSSDGLAAAVLAIARASGSAARLDPARLPLEPAMAALPQAQRWCLHGGEDFELVLALERTWADALVQVLPGSTVIGELTTGPAGELRWTEGGDPMGETAEAGYQHFR